MIRKAFLDSYIKSVPRAQSNYYKVFQKSNKFILHHPIIANKIDFFPSVSLKALQKIPKNNMIFQLDTGQSFTDVGYSGATPSQIQIIEQKYKNFLGKTSLVMTDQMKSILKIIVQIWANQRQIYEGEMPLRGFAYTLTQGSEQTCNDISKYQTAMESPHLYHLSKSNSSLIKQFYQAVSQNMLKIEMSEQDFNVMFFNIRNYLRAIKSPQSPNQMVSLLAPFVCNVQQSYQPNCRLVGKYFTHLRSSFYCLEATRNIEVGQQLVVPYKKQMNYYDILFRHGKLPDDIFQDDKHEHQEFIMPIDLLEDAQNFLLTGDIEIKREKLLQNNLNMKQIIKLKTEGRLKQQDMKMLRIIYTGEDEGESSMRMDEHIYKQVAKTAYAYLKLISQKKMKHPNPKNPAENDLTYKSIKLIQKTEQIILQQFVQKHLKL